MRLLRFCAAALLAFCLACLPLASAWSAELVSGQTSIAPHDIRALGGGSASQLGALLQQSKLSYTSALGVFGPIQLAKLAGVGVNAAAVDDEITIGPNALLVIPADMAQYPTGLISTERGMSGQRARIAFDSGARLYIPNAKMGLRYTLFARELLIEATGGYQLDLPASVIADSPLFVPDWESSYGASRALSFRPAFIDEIYPRTSAATQVFLLDALQKDIIGPAHVNDASGGVRLLSRAIDNRYLGGDADAVARTLQSVQDVAQAGGVASMAWNAHQLLPDAMTQRTSFRPRPAYQTPARSFPPTDDAHHTPDAAGLAAGDSMAVGAGRVSLWAQPLYRHWSYSGVEGMNVNFAHDLNASLGGLALGVDYTIPALLCTRLRAGLAAGMGAGHASGGEEYSATENSMTFHSLGAYLALEWHNWLLAGEVSYTSASHELTQELDHRLGMGDLTADVRTQSHGYNVRLEHHSDFDWFTAVEHVGLGETWLDTESYSAKSGGMTVLRGKPLHQQIGTFSAGLALERTFEFDDGATGDGWWLKPAVEYSVTYAYGDVQVLAPISLNGLGGLASQAYSQTTVTDPVTHKLGLGLYGGNTTLRLGLVYDHTMSTHGQGHGLQASFTWQF